MPDLYIIMGSNGSGKSTIGSRYLPAIIKSQYPIFDGDKLFMQKQKDLWQSGMRAHKEAKKIAYEYVTDTFDTLVEQAIAENENFIYEGHFTNDATWDIPKRFKSLGYKINFVFLGLSNPDLSEFRVIDRANLGGHYVDRRTIEDNFYGNLEKLNYYFELADNLQVIDSSDTTHLIIAIFTKGVPQSFVSLKKIPKWFSRYLPNLYKQIELFLQGHL